MLKNTISTYLFLPFLFLIVPFVEAGADVRAQQAVMKDRQDYLNQVFQWEANEGHALANYGWANSRLLGEADGVALYLASSTPAARSEGNLQLIMLHDVSNGRSALPDAALLQSGGLMSTTPEYWSLVEDLLGSAPAVGTGQNVYHYFRGYHFPKDDRLQVMGPRGRETPIFITYYSATFRDGRYRLSERAGGIMAGTIGTRPYRGEQPVVTLAGAVELYGESAPVAKNAMPDVLLPLEPEGPSEEYLVNQRRIRVAAIERGLIYRNDAFWSGFESTSVRAVFEGYAEYRRTGIGEKAVLMRYLQRLSNDCPSTIKNPMRFTFKEITTRTSDLGSSTSTDVIWDLTVPGRFEGILQRNYDDPGSTTGETVAAVVSVFQPGGLSRLGRDIAMMRSILESAKLDVDRIFDAGPCNDPLKVQLEEMLFYYQNDQDPAAHSDLRFPNARVLSDRLYEPGSAPDMPTACLANRDFPTDDRTIEYCKCVTGVVAANAPDRVSRYTKRHRQFWRDFNDAQTAFDRGQFDDPGIAVFGNMQSTCVKD